MADQEVMKKSNNDVLASILETEFLPEFPEDLYSSEYEKIDLAQLANLGNQFAVLKQAVDQLRAGRDGQSGIYRVVCPENATLAKFKDGHAFFGGCKDIDNKLFAGQAQLTPVMFDPVAMSTALVLVEIEHKMNEIKEIELSILRFMEEDKKSELRSALRMMTEIYTEYKYNIENDNWKIGSRVKVLDIKQLSEHNIDFYEKEIKHDIHSYIKDMNILKGLDLDKKFESVTEKFRYYNLSIYLYVFSLFLKTMLDENFNHEYLETILKQVNTQLDDYNAVYSDVYEVVDKEYRKQFPFVAKKGIAIAGNALGDACKVTNDLLGGLKDGIKEKSPIEVNFNIKLKGRSERKSEPKKTFDQVLKHIGSKVDENNESSLELSLRNFKALELVEVDPFVENIHKIDRINNLGVNMLIEQDVVYIGINE